MNDAKYFIDVELPRLMTNSERRLATMGDLPDKNPDITLGEFIAKIAEELVYTSEALKKAVIPHAELKLLDIK